MALMIFGIVVLSCLIALAVSPQLSLGELQVQLEVGDLIFAKNYIYYPWRGQHVSVVVNDTHVAQAVPPFILGGVVTTPINELHQHWAYKFFGGIGQIYRIRHADGGPLTDMEKQGISDYALKQVGKPFLFWSPKWSESTWYCEKLVWRSIYVGTGLDTDSNYQLGERTVTGDDMKHSPYAYEVANLG